MRNTANIDNINGLNVMNINIETNNTTAFSCNQIQSFGLPVTTKSSTTQSKPKTKCLESSGRQTKRPPSERRFKCDQCERMFFTRKDVKRHLVVHTGIRNFACPFCTQRFGRKDHLVRHAKKSHNRDTRSSTAIKTNSNHTSNQTNSLPTLIQPKSATIPVVPIGTQQTNPNNKSFNYQNHQNSGNSAMILLTNSHNSHNTSADNHSSNYGTHSNTTGHNIGMHANESFCQFMSGVHSFDEMIASTALKSETPPLSAPLGAHHYFAFPVNSSALTYPVPNSSFLPNCFVTNANPNMSSCGSTATVTAFGIPVPNVSNTSNPIHTTFSVDVNPSLPHFNQAFQ